MGTWMCRRLTRPCGCPPPMASSQDGLGPNPHSYKRSEFDVILAITYSHAFTINCAGRRDMRQSAVAIHRAYTVLGASSPSPRPFASWTTPTLTAPPTAFWHELRLAGVPAAMLHRPFRFHWAGENEEADKRDWRMQARGPACLVLELTPAMIVCRGHLMPFRRLGGPSPHGGCRGLSSMNKRTRRLHQEHDRM